MSGLVKGYRVTVRIKVEPGPTFESRAVEVRAYDASDAMIQALVMLADPRVDGFVSVEPAEWPEERLRFDLARMFRGERSGP